MRCWIQIFLQTICSHRILDIFFPVYIATKGDCDTTLMESTSERNKANILFKVIDTASYCILAHGKPYFLVIYIYIKLYNITATTVLEITMQIYNSDLIVFQHKEKTYMR